MLRNCQQRLLLRLHNQSRYFSSADLICLENAQFSYNKNDAVTYTVKSLSIHSPKMGGHAVLGGNGSGKTLLGQALHDPEKYILNNNNNDAIIKYPASENGLGRKPLITHVSFESHQELLQSRDNHNNIVSVQKAITSKTGGHLNKAAQFLVVRFGLYALLHREVSTLSTGEIRKVLIVRALSQRPALLILDNAFDGLDVDSRKKLLKLVKQTLAGFKQDLLVQAVNSKNTAHTQVLLITHRHEEIVDQIQHISYFEGNDDNHSITLKTIQRGKQSAQKLIQMALDASNVSANAGRSIPNDKLRKWYNSTNKSKDTNNIVLVEANNLTLQRGTSVLLRDLTWQVKRGERWWIAGGNGQGKSTLSRLLAQQQHDNDNQQLKVNIDSHQVGWVSTELHLQLSHSDKTVREMFNNIIANSQDDSDALLVANYLLNWMGNFTNDSNDDDNGNTNFDNNSLWDCPFSTLSQGQQKLVLLTIAISQKPTLLVLDEPSQGLDAIHRDKLLKIIEQLCQTTEMSLIYITHHADEVVDSVEHVMHLVEGQAVFIGNRSDYTPVVANDDDE